MPDPTPDPQPDSAPGPPDAPGRTRPRSPRTPPGDSSPWIPPAQRSSAALLARVMGLRGPEGLEAARRLLEMVGGRVSRLALPNEGSGAQGPGGGLPRIGPAALDRLAAALELGRRAARETGPNLTRLRGPEDVVRLMAPVLRGLRHEEFHVVVLDARHRVLRTEVVSRGILDASLVHPREVFAPAITARAAAVILVHNHPSGDPEPSPEDRRVSEQMQRAGEILGVRVLDHVVIGDPGWRTVQVPRAT